MEQVDLQFNKLHETHNLNYVSNFLEKFVLDVVDELFSKQVDDLANKIEETLNALKNSVNEAGGVEFELNDESKAIAFYTKYYKKTTKKLEKNEKDLQFFEATILDYNFKVKEFEKLFGKQGKVCATNTLLLLNNSNPPSFNSTPDEIIVCVMSISHVLKLAEQTSIPRNVAITHFIPDGIPNFKDYSQNFDTIKKTSIRLKLYELMHSQMSEEHRKLPLELKKELVIYIKKHWQPIKNIASKFTFKKLTILT